MTADELPQLRTPILSLPDVLAELVACHLAGRESARLGCTCAQAIDQYANEMIWEKHVRARWFDGRWLQAPDADATRPARRRRVPRLNPKQCGANTWARAWAAVWHIEAILQHFGCGRQWQLISGREENAPAGSR